MQQQRLLRQLERTLMEHSAWGANEPVILPGCISPIPTPDNRALGVRETRLTLVRYAQVDSSDNTGLRSAVQLDALQTLALSVAQATSPAQVLDEMVRGLGMTEGVALARVWLIEDEADERTLRLRASVGFSIVDPSVRWSRTDGGHERIPLSYGKIGKITSTGRPLLLQRDRKSVV